MRVPRVALFCVCLCLVVSIPLNVITAAVAIQTGNNTQTLLLNGKTASAKSAKKTAHEVQSLLTDHAQTLKSQKELGTAIALIETHLDKTIRHTVTQVADQIAREFQTAPSK